MYFTKIRQSLHYLEEHSHEIPWEEVVNIIFSVKNPRKKGNCFEIEKERIYILFTIRNNELIVINAKRS